MTAASDAPARAGLMRWAAMSLLGALGLAAFLLFVAGATPDAATAGLIVGAGALTFSLATMFRMVQALAKPGQTLGTNERDLAGVNRGQLREEKRRLLRAINELTFDFEMGKLSEADYKDVRQTYELRAVEVMRELDGSKRAHPEVSALLEERGLHAPAADKDAEDEAPAKDEGVEANVDDAAEDTEAEAKSAADDAESTLMCGSCGNPNDADAKFCKHCGKELSA
ncbi:MAG: zinc ribbon domain-containing protein [Myxococcota bacterium]